MVSWGEEEYHSDIPEYIYIYIILDSLVCSVVCWTNLNDPIDTTWIELFRGTLPEFLTHNIFSYNKMIIVLYQYEQIDIT